MVTKSGEQAMDAAGSARMSAVARHRYGGVEVLAVEQVARPRPVEGEVLVEVRAAGLERGSRHLMTGRPYMARLVFGLRAPARAVLGTEVSGVVVEAPAYGST